MRRLRIKRLAAFTMAILMFVIAGCSGKDKSKDDTKKEAAKGRYIETMVSLPEEVSYFESITKMEDGTLRFMAYNGIYDSTDGGVTWTAAENIPPFLKEVYAAEEEEEISSNISSSAVAKDGSMFYLYSKYRFWTETDEEGEEEYKSETLEEKYYYVDKDGNEKELTINLPELDLKAFFDEYYEEGFYEEHYADMDISNTMYNILFTPDGNIVGANGYGQAYHIDINTGEILHTFEYGESVNQMQIVDGKLLLSTWSEIFYYDLETGEETKLDDNLIGFLMNEYDYVESCMIDIVGDDTLILYKQDVGVYKYKLGGDEVEPLLDADKYTLSNSNYYFNSMVAIDEDTLLFTCMGDVGMKILKLVYSEDAPAPDKELTVYSLTENEFVKQAVSEFQLSNPDYDVTYEYGLDWEENGPTLSDILSKLNTDILGGEGPDVLIMNGLTMDSYIERGVLKDLTGLLDEVREDTNLFDNIVDVYSTDSGNYAVPVRFSTQLLMGTAEDIKDLTSLEALASFVETERNSGDNLRTVMGQVYSESFINLMLAVTPQIINEDGTIDEQLLTQFLTNVKGMYENNVRADVREEEDYEWLEEALDSYGDIWYANSYISNIENAVLYALSGLQKIAVGGIDGMQALNDMWPLVDEMNWEYRALASKEGQNTFISSTTAAINAQANNLTEAETFVKFLLSKDVQTNAYWGYGLPVSEDAYDQLVASYLDPDDDNNQPHESRWSSDELDDDGKELNVSYMYRKGTAEEYETFKEHIKSLNTVSVSNGIITTTVLREAERCMYGLKTADQAVQDILDAINLYLAE